jgi:hypothetical protein
LDVSAEAAPASNDAAVMKSRAIEVFIRLSVDWHGDEETSMYSRAEQLSRPFRT